MDELLKYLKTNYNYSDELLKFLNTLIPTMINYYGEEYKDKIIATFVNTPIFLEGSEFFKDESIQNMVDFTTAGGHLCETRVENGSIIKTGKVILNNNDFNFNDIHMVGILVHELCHAVKSGIINNQDSAVTYIGLEQIKETIVNADVFVQSNNKGIGLEEALNAMDEYNIMNMLYGNYDITSQYKRLFSIVSQFVNGNEELLHLIRESQFKGTSVWETYLGEEKSKELIELCNIHNDYMTHRVFELLTDEKLKQEFFEIENKIMEIVSLSKNISHVGGNSL